jgi:two-component system chemotaxis response regulator CheB
LSCYEYEFVEKRNIIVIGASAGGFDALKKLIAHLPSELDASIFIVWHMSPDVQGILPTVLNKVNNLYAAHAEDKEPIKPNRIYVAKPDWHLLIEKGRVRVTHGPKENRFRPAVDPLFRSAAYAYGPRVIGVILSGALNDGTAGLWAVKLYGGTAIVQDPKEAEFDSMPQSAISAVKVDYKESLVGIASRLETLCQELVEEKIDVDMDEIEKTKVEVGLAMQEPGLEDKMLKIGQLSPYACPECHGVLSAIKDGDRFRFRCHTGHAFSAESLLSVLSENIETSLWNSIRGIEETIWLLRTMGDHYAALNQPRIAALYFKKATEAEERVGSIRKSVLKNEHLSVDDIELSEKEFVDGLRNS